MGLEAALFLIKPFSKFIPVAIKSVFTGKREWATRSSSDEPGSLFGDGINIFDVRTKSEAVALDGTPYAQW